MLKPIMFIERDRAVENIIQIISDKCEEYGCSFGRGNIVPEEAKTTYLDTKAHELNGKFNFFYV